MLISETQKQTLVWRSNVTLWHHATLSYPENGWGHGNLGMAYLISGDYNCAVKHFEISISLDQFRNINLIAFAYASLKTGQFNRAIDLYNIILTMNKNKQSPGLDLGCLYYSIGWGHAKLSQYNLAKTALNQVTPSSSQYKNVQQLLSIILDKKPIPNLKRTELCLI